MLQCSLYCAVTCHQDSYSIFLTFSANSIISIQPDIVKTPRYWIFNGSNAATDNNTISGAADELYITIFQEKKIFCWLFCVQYIRLTTVLRGVQRRLVLLLARSATDLQHPALRDPPPPPHLPSFLGPHSTRALLPHFQTIF